MACPVKGTHNHFIDARSRLAAPAMHNLLLGNARNSAKTRDAMYFAEQLGPVPGAQPAPAQAQIDQIKKVTGKLKHAQGVHDMELDASCQRCGLRLLSRIGNHAPADID